MPLRQLEGLSPTGWPPPRAFIFHIGHCGSTLLSRLLDCWPGTLGLREPRVLRDLAVLRDADARTAWLSPSGLKTLLAQAITLLGRRFPATERVAVKATSSCNTLIEPLLAASPQTRAVFMHMPLETYLATLFKAPSRLDALTFAPLRLAWLQQRDIALDVHLHALDEPQIIALGWIAEMLRCVRLQRGALGSRMLAIDFESFLREPADGLAMAAEHFGFPDPGAIAAIAVASDVMRAYSKAPDHAYGVKDRDHDLDLARRRFGPEIAKALQFADSLVARHPQLQDLETSSGNWR